MRVRSVDINNDWLFGKGRNDYKRDKMALAQKLKTRIQSFLGDCFFAQNEGIDWFNLLGSKRTADLQLAITTIILNTEGVTEITSLNASLNKTTRNISIVYSVNTIYGEVSGTSLLSLGVS